MDPALQRRINYAFFAPCWVAPLSILGSALTLRAIYHQFREKNALTTYQRLLMGISTSDLVFSTALAFGPFPIRSELREFGVPAYGTVGTCAAQGFVLQLGAASFAYSSMLLGYFVLVIRYNATTRSLRRIEPFMHAIPIVFHAATALLGLAWKVYNPSGIHCWVGAWPPGCNEDPETECERGGGGREEVFGLWFSVYPYIFWACLTIFWTVVIAATVAQQNRTRLSYRFAARSAASNNTNPQGPMDASSSARSSSRRASFTASYYTGYACTSSARQSTRGQAKLQQAVTQAMLYGLWFLNFTFWSLLSYLFGLAGKELDLVGQHFWLGVCVVTFFPMQGLFNFVIYVRPTYANIRARFPAEGRWFAAKEAVWRPFASHRERLGGGGRHNSNSKSNNSSSSQKTPPPVVVGKEEEEEDSNHAQPPMVQPETIDNDNPQVLEAAPSPGSEALAPPEESAKKSVAFRLPDCEDHPHEDAA